MTSESTVREIGRVMGDVLARGKEREIMAKMAVIEQYMRLIQLELDIFFAGRPPPGEA